jgi:GT2 family glycosyltransferase
VADPARFSVLVPSRGDPAKLIPHLEALARQTLPRDRFEVIVALDGVAPAPELDARIAALGARVARLAERSGPGAARNAGAALAHESILAFTEDDVTPAPDWLERAARRFEADPAIDVLEGATTKPEGRPVRIRDAGGLTWLPTNLFVRRALFQRVGGYHEGYFDRELAVYFREDSDLGFTLEQAGARIVPAPEVMVTHPDEHPGLLDPLRWARRYEMDPLLARRHPKLFRERIEIHRLGPFRIRRPIVRASWLCVLAVIAALAAPLFGRATWTASFMAIAIVAFLPIWAKWSFSLARLPVALLVPFALVAAWLRGRLRVASGVLR